MYAEAQYMAQSERGRPGTNARHVLGVVPLKDSPSTNGSAGFSNEPLAAHLLEAFPIQALSHSQPSD
jgi:hypothetical protein